MIFVFLGGKTYVVLFERNDLFYSQKRKSEDLSGEATNGEAEVKQEDGAEEVSALKLKSCSSLVHTTSLIFFLLFFFFLPQNVP